ncbi:hypothetical protein HETIRDRAFT_324250 [Heterobasidion irregulare TC 32-1]|uniref:Uncharacterized protein n=1 Tax=Heterobasidion irregulare (strain TC 32-1) TaxID=747525 RepID=W4K0G6_HETIT|nr:uncharacterized protein HETIRDRAFT_324250 [Heterobasidion irregulare TC 32-1]ETW78626.1 hypothetical protein HETIRDRAFT_324250 [Heterobasidion irregulare TC 32-1]
MPDVPQRLSSTEELHTSIPCRSFLERGLICRALMYSYCTSMYLLYLLVRNLIVEHLGELNTVEIVNAIELDLPSTHHGMRQNLSIV